MKLEMVKIDTKHKLNSALIGMILFDGSMPNERCLYLRHGGKQLDYVNEKVEFISAYYQPKSIRQNKDKSGDDYRYAYYKEPKLKYLYHDIYIDGHKSMTKNILNRFDAITLSIMYMDDGCLSLRKKPQKPGFYSAREIHLNVQSFTFDEANALQKLLHDKWGIEFKLTIDKGKPRLWCNTQNTIDFLKIVAPVIQYNFPTMYYKLDLKYHTKNINFLP